MKPDDETSEPDAAPPAQPSGLAGMDLVRRVLEAARGAARTQGKDVGRGRRLPPARRVAGSGSRRRWSGPGPDTRDPQPLASVTRDVAKKQGWSARVAEGAADGRRSPHRRTRDAHGTARWGADRDGGIDGLGDATPNHPASSAGQNRRRGRRRSGDQPENRRPGLTVLAEGAPAYRRTRAA